MIEVALETCTAAVERSTVAEAEMPREEDKTTLRSVARTTLLLLGLALTKICTLRGTTRVAAVAAATETAAIVRAATVAVAAVVASVTVTPVAEAAVATDPLMEAVAAVVDSAVAPKFPLLLKARLVKCFQITSGSALRISTRKSLSTI